MLKQYLLPVGVALAILLPGLDYIYTWGIIKNPFNHTLAAYKVYKAMDVQQGIEEIPIFGSSRASGSFVPGEINPKCFNYGIEKTQFDLLEIMLASELKKNNSTPIIINLDYEFFSDWKGNQANYVPSFQHEAILEYAQHKYSFTQRIPLIRYFGFFDDYNKNFLSHLIGSSILDKGGFFLTNPFSASAFETLKKRRLETSAEWKDRPKKQQRFLELLKEANNRKVYIFIAPYHNSYMVNLKNEAEAQVYFDQLAALPNVIFRDFSSVDYPDDHYMNTTHLNHVGAKRFSKEVGKVLMEE